jgi:hypothetical protein
VVDGYASELWDGLMGHPFGDLLADGPALRSPDALV